MKKTRLILMIVALMACSACTQLSGKDAQSPLTAEESTVPLQETGIADAEIVSKRSDLRQMDATRWYSGVLDATLDFPDEWEGLFTLESIDSQVIMRMVPPTDYGGLLCFFQREPQSDWAGAQNKMAVWIELVAESADYVIIMTRPGDEQAAPEYREQYYEIADRLSDIVVTFGE
jgi:hypothetical protein